MDFLRRLRDGDAPKANVATKVDPADLEAEELEHEHDLMRAEQERLGELQERQLRYEKYAWRPPAQGGERRADDEEGSTS